MVSKITNASSRAMEKSKTFHDINWEEQISGNKLEKLYVSQLNLYLIHQMGMTKAQSEAKGYIKAQKIEDIKKHYYTSQPSNFQPTCTTKTQPQQPSINISFPQPKQPIPSVPPNLNIQVPPWGGAVYNSNIAVRRLINTCPIDNFLTIFYVLLRDNILLHQRFLNSAERYAAQLIQIKDLFDQGQFSEGKILWLCLFPPGRFNMTLPVLDLWGNEEDFSVPQIEVETISIYQGTCNFPSCPCPVREFRSHSICLRYCILWFKIN